MGSSSFWHSSKALHGGSLSGATFLILQRLAADYAPTVLSCFMKRRLELLELFPASVWTFAADDGRICQTCTLLRCSLGLALGLCDMHSTAQPPSCLYRARSNALRYLHEGCLYISFSCSSVSQLAQPDLAPASSLKCGSASYPFHCMWNHPCSAQPFSDMLALSEVTCSGERPLTSDRAMRQSS